MHQRFSTIYARKSAPTTAMPPIRGAWLNDATGNLVIEDLKHKPSPAQVAAMVLHLALGRIPQEDLAAATRRQFA